MIYCNKYLNMLVLVKKYINYNRITFIYYYINRHVYYTYNKKFTSWLLFIDINSPKLINLLMINISMTHMLENF